MDTFDKLRKHFREMRPDWPEQTRVYFMQILDDLEQQSAHMALSAIEAAFVNGVIHEQLMRNGRESALCDQKTLHLCRQVQGLHRGHTEDADTPTISDQ